MQGRKEFLTAICTFGCAMAIGFVMQSTEEAKLRYGSPANKQQTAQIDLKIKDASLGSTILDVTDITLTSATVRPLVDLSSEVETLETFLHPKGASAEPHLVFASACDMDVSATPQPAAMVRLTVAADCLPQERVTVHHNGMMFTEETTDTGTLDVTIPALTEDAVFVVAFSSGEGAVVNVQVEDLSDFDRAVLQWKGNLGFQIHAREFGSEYGSKGHHWPGHPGQVSAALSGEAGLLVSLGRQTVADPLLAQVYTFPRKIDSRSDEITLTVEAEVTAENCGQEIEAQSMDRRHDGVLRAHNLLLPIPACDQVGSFLVLNNLLQNMKVASN